MATGILVFDLELFIGGRYYLLGNVGTLFAESDEQGIYTSVDPVLRHVGGGIGYYEYDVETNAPEEYV